MSIPATLGIEWRDPLFLQHFMLTKENVLDYFALSVFYDHSCNNEVLKMQSKFNNLTMNEADLLQMTGIEYRVCYEQEEQNMFVIVKLKRYSSSKAAPLTYYYVANSNIYQAPTVHDLLSSRLQTCLHHLKDSFDFCNDYYGKLQDQKTRNADKIADDIMPPDTFIDSHMIELEDVLKKANDWIDASNKN